jgi:hypothetical protein
MKYLIAGSIATIIYIMGYFIGRRRHKYTIRNMK